MKEKENPHSEQSPIYSSSDTVNELLQGLVCENDAEIAIKKLTSETSEVLPTFSNVLNSRTGEMIIKYTTYVDINLILILEITPSIHTRDEVKNSCKQCNAYFQHSPLMISILMACTG